MKTSKEFNEKYSHYLEKGHYGCDLGDCEELLNIIHTQFQEWIKVPGFKYSQIKLKFNHGRVYVKPGTIDTSGLEKKITGYFGVKPNEAKRIILNRIQTPDGTILTSYHVHDYITHVDANGEQYMVDGGNEYLRRNITATPYKDLSVYSDEPFVKIRENFHRGGRGKDGTEPLKWVPLSEMNDEWVAACIEYNNERGMHKSFANEMYKKELIYREINNIYVKDESN